MKCGFEVHDNVDGDCRQHEDVIETNHAFLEAPPLANQIRAATARTASQRTPVPSPIRAVAEQRTSEHIYIEIPESAPAPVPVAEQNECEQQPPAYESPPSYFQSLYLMFS